MKIDISDLVYAVNYAASGLAVVILGAAVVVSLATIDAAKRVVSALEEFREIHIKLDEEECDPEPPNEFFEE